ncbi:MAG: 3-hydroxyacyl-CoA dehydrogenase [Phormidesmis sp. FL-bin-119]|nr:3-hydroxyacyl-CoA dehydrogenase [Pedobacter sp.]
MNSQISPTDSILIIGDCNLTASVSVCLLNAGHEVDVYTTDPETYRSHFEMHIASQQLHIRRNSSGKQNILDNIPARVEYKLVILITPENFEIKKTLLNRLEYSLQNDAIIAVNSESIALDVLQGECKGHNLLALNWSEPAHTTFFLEIIYHDNEDLALTIKSLAKLHWGKDPYIVESNGIRSRLLSAMAREAAFLIDNEYASVEDIDRACRNDAGYYLPFSGNCRYMDLMGTYAYGMVMKDLNPNLSTSKGFPEFFQKILNEGRQGMKNEKGFYNYGEGDIMNWEKTMEEFSYSIKSVIERYPFNYTKNKEAIID